MRLLVAVLLVAAVLFAIGFIVKVVWVAALVVLLVWLLLFAGNRRRPRP
jgi:hypothetical protein